ncbi:MAG TPA: hypothetical protein DCS13_07580 [Candidatus Margulisbacteria bacterium]|nr:hypothetical protein [Candidatus Margulisiibacteriota bacterium]
MIRHKWFPGVDIKAIHEPIINLEIFYKVQAILEGNNPLIAPKVRNNPDFPLRNFVICPKCGKKITGSWSKGRTKRYAYYHCTSQDCSFSVKKEALEEAFYELMKTIRPKKNIQELFKVIVVDRLRAKQSGLLKDQVKLEQELRELEERKDRIVELLINKRLSEEIFDKKLKEADIDIMVKRNELNEASIDLDDAEACVNYCNYWISNLHDLWLHSNLDLRQRFQNMVFPEGTSYQEDGTFRTVKLSRIYEVFEMLKTGDSRVVAPEGIEPSSPT